MYQYLRTKFLKIKELGSKISHFLVQERDPRYMAVIDHG